MASNIVSLPSPWSNRGCIAVHYFLQLKMSLISTMAKMSATQLACKRCPAVCGCTAVHLNTNAIRVSCQEIPVSSQLQYDAHEQRQLAYFESQSWTSCFPGHCHARQPGSPAELEDAPGWPALGRLESPLAADTPWVCGRCGMFGQELSIAGHLLQLRHHHGPWA